ncbi:MAG: redoxin domain-containing protein, partial [Thermomicrobiales bacterium]
DALLLIARLALAGIFAVAGVGKLLDLAGSQQAVKSFGLPERLAKPGGIALPIVELIIAALLLPVTTARYGAIAGFILMVVFISAIANQLRKGNTPDCHCFGQIHSEPAGPKTLIRNGIFAAVALFIAIAGWNDAGTSLTGWVHDRSGFDWFVLALGVVAIAGLAISSWITVHILGQNGRLLLKLDELEEQIAAISSGKPLPSSPKSSATAKSEPQRGLPIGTLAPAFRLEGVHGETQTLDALRAAGKPVLLVFTDPGCGPCNALLPDVAAWQQELSSKLTIAVLSRGTVEKNLEKIQAHGLSTVLIQPDRTLSDAYQAIGTPSAVLVQATGTIGSQVEGGAEKIRDFVKSFRENGAADRAVIAAPPKPFDAAADPVRTNNGSAQPPRPHMGDPAPAFSLPDLDGNVVALSDFKGQDTVLIFWSPTCGFCKRMGDDLKAWEAAPGAGNPKAVFITSGDEQLNRDFGFSSTVLLDQPVGTMRLFGASGTPSAILVDKDGNVASQLRVGQPGVMALLRNEEAPPAPAAAPPVQAATIGQPAPAVHLQDIDGNHFDLASRRGEKTLLVFWNPTCGFCSRMVDDLKAWEGGKPADAPGIVLVSTGSVESNRAQGFTSTVLIDQAFQTGRAFGATGTPSAVLIDENGNVASGVAVGSPKVLGLAGAPQPV